MPTFKNVIPATTSLLSPRGRGAIAALEATMLISRDPFAREEIHRETEATQERCAWCDNNKRNKKYGNYLYRYRVESDGGRKSEDKRLFDSIQCRRAYYGR